MLIAILGRQPAISLAELESLFGADQIKPLGQQAALIDLEPAQVDLRRLGGTMKLAKQLTELDAIDASGMERFLVTHTPKHVKYLPDGKLRLGLSLYGFTLNPKQLLAIGLSTKKAIRKAGRSVRLVPNKELALSTAQVTHNQLTGPLGWELVFIRHGNRTLVGQTVAVQDIRAYTARDQARPKRDARVGMLPPKLAQIIINLAVDQTTVKSLLDPFCGTGVIPQEAALMGYSVLGTDIDLRMVEFTKANLDWLREKASEVLDFQTEVADATSQTWRQFDAIATETYLGRSFSALPKPAVLDEVVHDVDTIIKKFLQNVARQTKPGFRLCLALPAWKKPRGFRHLPLLDHLTDLGYTHLSFVHAKNDELIYHREGQIVGRELVLLTRN